MKTYNKETLAHWLFQRATAILLLPTIVLANPATFFLLIVLVSLHLFLGLEEILADYVHHEVTRNFILKLLRIFLLIIIKYAIVLFIL
uniref:Succinate:cytochrome c oxidoreductase subunit 4 n=1 Tax=Gonatozygon brebissonii TaxID=184482 RepID=A0A6G9IGA2_9VIRI|nr:succinate:cytochrome c oxidoreductase subunit 4 [Gonatozygon brebissonii]QIQ23063.1 succinate:cytochrome c oxidoreductase subunit 4 [Gonatozygon brebissonii]